MAIYVVTGAASGIGQAVTELLASTGNTIITVDLANADINVDLSTVAGRNDCIEQLSNRCPEGIDGLVPCAGLGPDTTNKVLIPRVNFFAVTALVNGLLPLLSNRKGRCVLISSNSATMGDPHHDYHSSLLAADEAKATAIAETLDGQTLYGGSKLALAQWMRQNAKDLAKAGVRINAVAPGITKTAMTDKVFADPQFGAMIKDFAASVPIGYVATPMEIAKPIIFLLSDQASYCHGSVLFVDGGHDALFRPMAM